MRLSFRRVGLLGSVVASCSVSAGCGAYLGGDTTGGSGDLDAPDSSPADPCTGGSVVVPKRIVRLTEHQLFNSYESLFGERVAAEITQREGLPSLSEREFPPISGDIGVSDTLFAKYDRLAQSAMAYASGNSGSLTPCGAPVADKRCAQHYLLSLAERAYRHPLSVEEQEAITGQFWTEMMAAGATLTEALAFGVYGVLSSPSFIYRTEFGASVAADGPLAPYELASAISFFLTDHPPDDELLAAAASNSLAKSEHVRAQAMRLLETPQARQNLEDALTNYFSLTNARTAILNPDVTPGLTLTTGTQSAIYREGELFLRNTLWAETLDELLTSQRTWTNAQIATEVYGVAPPVDMDEQGFGVVDLAHDRAGLLTLPAFLLAGARSTGGSPVARGLAVNRAFVCEINPSFPQVVDPESGREEPDPAVTEVINTLAELSERDQSEYRANAAQCATCHSQFDAYGMVLERYDAVGRLRTTDLQGRTIDERWTTAQLPEAVGGALVASAAQAAAALTDSGAFERCMAMNFINYALAEVSRGGAHNSDPRKGSQTQSCAVRAVVERFAATERSFSSLLSEIAASETLGVRRGGG